MAIYNEPFRRYDGFVTLEGGMNSGISADLLPPNQASFLVNATVRGGFPKPRPGIINVPLVFENEDDRDIFESYNVQGAEYYNAKIGNESLFASIGGRIFLIIPGYDQAQVFNLTPGADRNSQYQRHAYFQQAEQYMVIQDNQSKAFIWEGSSLRRAGDDEVPVGGPMAYGQGRLWVAQDRFFVAGDIVGGPTSVITFTETQFFAEGGFFSVPVNAGNITGMTFVTQGDTATGQGELLVFTRNSCTSVFAGIPRAQWKQTQIQAIALQDIGSMSHSSIVNVNGDVLFRSQDGIRSYRLARAQENSLGRTPMSREANRVLLRDDERSLEFAQATFFDNRVLMTCTPIPLPNGAYHLGMIAVDYDATGGITSKSTPVYDGLWVGIRPITVTTGIFRGVSRCFSISRDSDGTNRLYEISRDSKFDSADGEDDRITWTIETKSFDHQSPLSLKKLQRGDLFLSEITGQIEVDVKYRPNNFNCWVDWHSFEDCATYKQCEFTGCPTLLQNFKPQYRVMKRLPEPDNDCDSITNELFRNAYDYQIRIQITGYAMLVRYRNHADELDEPSTGKC